jgi:DNA (cytosine-5)-methyltransferase 1
MRTVAFCEIEPYCRAVLEERWPEVPCFGDIRGIDSYELGRLGGIDVICGGFPCQDISVAGAGAGLAGARSGLWSEYARVISLVRPRYVIVENVAALLGRGLGDVLGDLASIGYDAEWHCIPAAHVGAPHRRDRIWIVANPAWDVRSQQETRRRERIRKSCESVDLANSKGLAERAGLCESKSGRQRWGRSGDGRSENYVADTDGGRSQGPRNEPQATGGRPRRQSEFPFEIDGRQWSIEPNVGRVADGVPARVDRLRALGNAVVPQIPYLIGRAIMATVNTQAKQGD